MHDLVGLTDVCSTQRLLITSPGFIADWVSEHCREQQSCNVWLTQQKRRVVWQLSESFWYQNITGYFCHSHLTNSAKPSMPGAHHSVSFGSKPPHFQSRPSTLLAAKQIFNRRRAELSCKCRFSSSNCAALRQSVQLRHMDFREGITIFVFTSMLSLQTPSLKKCYRQTWQGHLKLELVRFRSPWLKPCGSSGSFLNFCLDLEVVPQLPALTPPMCLPSGAAQAQVHQDTSQKLMTNCTFL